MSEETSSVILDGTNPTLNASELSYEFEKTKFTGKYHTYYDRERRFESFDWRFD